MLDGPARASSATLEIARASDLVVQPTGASLDDLEPAVLTFHELVKEGEKLLFVLCRMQTDAEVRDCRGYLNQAGYAILEGFLPERPAYRSTEIRYRSLRRQAESLVQGIVDRIS